jgi:CubicO group peptidase (beta-lactamase class C family)
MKHSTFPLLLALALAAGASRAEPDEATLNKANGYPIGNAGTWYTEAYRVGSWSALDKVPGVQTRVVARGEQASPLPRAANPAPLAYRYKGAGYTLADYLDRQRATGLIVLKNGEIIAEHYRYGRKDDARFLSFSMAKSVTSLLIGKALSLGLIASLDDPAEKYAKDLAGSPYGATTVRQLLRMSSGLTFTERYDGKDDLSRLSRAAAGARGAGLPLDVLKSITDRHSPPGEKFVYASAETDVLGRVVAAAAGKNMSELTTEWLWKPMGAEHDAFWRVAVDGQEQANGGFNASLRDWARLGQLLANDGRAIDKSHRQARRAAGRAAGLPAGRHRPGAPAAGLPAAHSHALLRLRLPVLAGAFQGPHLRDAGHPRPDRVCAAVHRHRDGDDLGLGAGQRQAERATL